MTKTERHDRPAAYGRGDELQVLRLASGGDGDMPGWCSYANQLSESPDIEIVCGGINSKAETAAAVWRQGCVLHFGFDLAPDRMTDACRALLVNSIVHVAKFEGQPPLLHAPSPFTGKGTRSRESFASWLADEKYDLEWSLGGIDRAALQGVATTDRAALRAWFAANRAFLRPGDDGKLTLDADVRRLGHGFDTREFLAAAIDAIDSDVREEFAAASRALRRFVPDGPGRDAGAEAWRAWYGRHRDRLFFSEWGGYRWYVAR